MPPTSSTQVAGRDDCFLGVSKSFTGKRWLARAVDSRSGLALAQELQLPEIVGRILAGRGVSAVGAESFLNPSLRDSLPNPSALKDMERAAERVARAVMGGERIAVFGDYDVDGATSSALLDRFLRQVGVEPVVYIPDRIEEGYGPNAPALLKLRSEGAGLVLTVDCGTTAFDPLEEAAATGLDVVVVDHHVAEPALPKAYAIVNPNRLDDESGQGQLAAVGVTFLLCVAVNRVLRQAGWFGQSRQEPDLRMLLDLVALGTVCDVVPLTGVNRAFVAQGLKIMSRRANGGIAALADVASVDERLAAYHLGFVLGPRVNAGGRVGQANLGAKILACDDAEQAMAMARRLDAFNAERKQIEDAVLQQALTQAEASAPKGIVTVAGQGWHPGVIGIVASRLKERFDLPSLVIALDEAGLGKGSGRSVKGVDFGAAVIAARQAGLLVNGGGHAMAAGLTVAAERLQELTEFLGERFQDQLQNLDYTPSLTLDGALQPGAANAELLAILDTVGPYGVGNAEPRFALSGVRIGKADVVGDNHVRLFVSGADGRRLKAIAFRALDSDLGPALLGTGGAPVHLAGRLRLDRWAGGDAVQMIVEDAAAA